MDQIPACLPAGLELYGRSPDFTVDTLPAKLRAKHSTKTGTWGLIHVMEGSILLLLEAPYYGERRGDAGETVVISPEVPHRVEFIESGRFFVEFYRQPLTN